jgi:hypothetical protein
MSCFEEEIARENIIIRECRVAHGGGNWRAFLLPLHIFKFNGKVFVIMILY